MGKMINPVLEQVIQRLRRKTQLKVAFPESQDERVLAAAVKLSADRIIEPILIGVPDEITVAAEKMKINIDGIRIIDSNDKDMLEDYSISFVRVREEQGKRVTPSVSRKMMENPLFIAAMLVKKGQADSMVAGAVNTTANVVRAALYLLGVLPDRTTLNSSFLMLTPRVEMGERGALFFADAGVNPDPTAEQLAEIAVSTAETASLIFETSPRLALLSFSTAGSASHPSIDKVRRAIEICREQHHEIQVDGELQADAALVPEVARIKCPDSVIGGNANVLIFPDLNAGNICYKMVERLCGAMALGPLLQNVSIPVSDLSRGCDVEAIYFTTAVTALRAHVARKT